MSGRLGYVCIYRHVQSCYICNFTIRFNLHYIVHSCQGVNHDRKCHLKIDLDKICTYNRGHLAKDNIMLAHQHVLEI